MFPITNNLIVKVIHSMRQVGYVHMFVIIKQYAKVVKEKLLFYILLIYIFVMKMLIYDFNVMIVVCDDVLNIYLNMEK